MPLRFHVALLLNFTSKQYNAVHILHYHTLVQACTIYHLIPFDKNTISYPYRLTKVSQYVSIATCVHTFSSLDEPVDLWYSDNVSEHVTQPLWIHKIEVTQCRCVVVKHDACRIKQLSTHPPPDQHAHCTIRLCSKSSMAVNTAIILKTMNNEDFLLLSTEEIITHLTDEHVPS